MFRRRLLLHLGALYVGFLHYAPAAVAGLILFWGAVHLFCAPTEAADREAVYNSISRAVQSATGDAGDLKKGSLYALVVGVAKYSDASIPELQLSSEDARAFGAFLDTQKKVFKNTHVKVLLNDKATRTEVEKCLRYDLLKAGKDDTVVLFFSGHGSGDPKKPGEYFFLVHDSDPNYLEATALKMTGLDFLNGLDANRILVITDACHAGAASRMKTKAIQRSLNRLIEEFKDSSGRVILSSSKPNEYSIEKQGLSNSVFTHYLLKGLKGEADSDRDGVVTFDELYEYVYERTKDETEGAQHPQKEGCVNGKFPVSVLGNLEDKVQVELWVVAQDPRCANQDCTDPQDETTPCIDPLCGDVSVTDGTTMHNGQNYQVAFRPSGTSHVYVYQIDAMGQIYKLFPGTDYLVKENELANPLKGGEIYWIPGKQAWLRHDDQQGKEKICVVASRSRNQVLEDLQKHLDKARAAQGGTSKTAELQEGMSQYLGKIMAPTQTAIRKAVSPKVTPVSRPPDQSPEFVSHIIESSGLDAAKLVWFNLRSR